MKNNFIERNVIWAYILTRSCLKKLMNYNLLDVDYINRVFLLLFLPLRFVVDTILFVICNSIFYIIAWPTFVSLELLGKLIYKIFIRVK